MEIKNNFSINRQNQNNSYAIDMTIVMQFYQKKKNNSHAIGLGSHSVNGKWSTTRGKITDVLTV